MIVRQALGDEEVSWDISFVDTRVSWSRLMKYDRSLFLKYVVVGGSFDRRMCFVLQLYTARNSNQRYHRKVKTDVGVEEKDLMSGVHFRRTQGQCVASRGPCPTRWRENRSEGGHGLLSSAARTLRAPAADLARAVRFRELWYSCQT